MRETKDQKISRLERQKKELERSNTEKNKEINKLKKQLIDDSNNIKLKKEFEEKEHNLLLTINKLNQENEKIKLELKRTKKIKEQIFEEKENKINECLTEISRLKTILYSHEIYDIEKPLKKEKVKLPQSYLDDIEYWNNRVLEEFNSRNCYATYKGCLPFFDEKLIITINPKTGARLADDNKYKILKIIGDNPLYELYIEKISKIDDEGKKEQLTYEYGRQLYDTLYLDFDFECL